MATTNSVDGAHAIMAVESTTLSTSSNANASAAQSLSFGALCRVLEAVERTPKSDAKLQLVFSDALRAQLHGGDLYPLLRLLLPQLDRERTYNLKEKKIAKVYIDVLGMATESRDAQKLEHFNDPTVVQSKSVGDFAAVLYDVLQYRSLVGNQRFQHTVGVVNALLDELVRADDAKARRQVFMKLAAEFPANEQKWIIRIMLKDLKIGLRHERVLNFMHPDAAEMYNHTNDLHKVCVDLRNSSIRYVPKIEPFQVFSPMLAKRVDFGDCTSAIQSDAFVMEPKLDGERITCHVQGDEVQFISRNGVNYSELYGPHVAPYVKSQLLPGLDVILDGEMMVWDNLEYKLREFGLLKNVANAMRAGEQTHRWLCYIVWDVVYLGGEPAQSLIHQVYNGPGELNAVMGLPLHARRKLLVKVLKPLDHRVIIIEQTLVNSKSAKERHDIVMAEVDKQVSNGGEGVILKDVNSHYMCGESSRKTKKWIKLKPDYAGMTTDLDVVIIGGFYGTGRRRSGNVSVFLLGVLARSLDDDAAKEAAKPGAPAPMVYTFAKVGTGYNLEELEQMRRELEPYWHPWDNDNIPAHFNGWKPQKSDLKPDVWIDPRHSKVLEVYGFELTFSTLYQTGLTIRFPRCKAIRNDKPWYQCMSVQDLNTIRGSVYNKRAADVALGQKKSTKRVPKKISISRGSSGIVAEYSRAKLEGIDVQQHIFEGLEFCVLPGKYETTHLLLNAIPEELLAKDERKSITKQTIEKLIHACGGSIVQNPIADSTSYVVAASDAGFKVVNLKNQGKFNIVYLHWLVGCIAGSRLLPLKARDFIFTTESTHALLAKEYDRFGDHFTEAVTSEELKLIFREVGRALEDKTAAEPWQSRWKALEMEEEDAMDSEFTSLAHCVVYLDLYLSIHVSVSDPSTDCLDPFGSMALMAQQIRLLGGRVSTALDHHVTHVVIASRHDQRRVELLQPVIRKIRRENHKEPPVVTKEWVDKCIAHHLQLPVDEFRVPV